MLRQDSEGWVLGRPLNPLHNRTWRVDRADIERYAKLTKVAMTPNLYPLAQINAVIQQIDLFSSGVPNGQFLLDDRRVSLDLTCILGTMSEEQLENCLRGGRISVSELTPKGKEFLKVLASQGGLNDLTPYDVKDAGTLNPLFYLPRGIEGMSIGASLRSEPEFRFEADPDEDHSPVQDVWSLARMLKNAKSDSPFFDAKFRLGSKRTLVATAYLGRKSTSDQSSTPIIEPDLPTYTWKTLPESVRQQVLNEMKKPSK
jgi:hypothetical protein